jgi:hypothetical protein
MTKPEMRRALAVKFFYANAGYSYDPKTETAEQGRQRCAEILASAEEHFIASGWHLEWQDDWDIGSHRDFYGEDSCYAKREPRTCEGAILKDSAGNVLASLWCIDNATMDYRRVIRAELASEAQHNEVTARRDDAL